MTWLMDKFEEKLVCQNLALPGQVLLGEWDDDLIWNRKHPTIKILLPLFDALNISTVLFSLPAEPYRTIVDYLAEKEKTVIRLKDNETRMFLHDIPVINRFLTEDIIHGLKHRKCVVIPGHGIATCGTISPEQTFINFSSVLFACFVKFFSEYIMDAARHRLEKNDQEIFDRVCSFLPDFPEVKDTFAFGPFESTDRVYDAISAVGKPMIHHGFVDSVMGNISYRFENKVYISQTGSLLDELEGYIDACPMDKSACTGITASSELPTHMAIYRDSDLQAIVHGHPKFSVILSMFCEKEANCAVSHDCNTRCPERRWIADVPIVIGETGSGPLAISHTVPPAMIEHQAVVVYGHGVFAAGKKDFNEPFYRLCTIEGNSREIYFERVKQLTK